MHVRAFRVLKPRRPRRRLIRSVSKNRPEFSTHRSLSKRLQCTRMDLLRHELRTPLTGILGMSELLRGSGLSGEQRDLVLALQESGRQMENLLRRMARPLSATDRGSAAELETVNGLQLLEQAVRAHWPAALKKGIGLHLVFDHRLPENWHSDAVCLRQLLDNLLANAIKFTHRGYVLVQAQLAGGRQQGRRDMELHVLDTGTGITGLAGRRIYAMREQGSAAVSRLYGGSGFGLFICERISALLGGSVQHQSSATGGTCFKVVLPGTADAGPGSVRRLRPAFLAGLRCQLGLHEPVKRVLTQWLRRMDVQVSRISTHELHQMPGGCDMVICDPDRIGVMIPGLQIDAGRGGPVLLLSAAGDGGGGRAFRAMELPQPILHSNLEPLLLRLALQRAIHA